jgi:UDP-N-acetylmuramoyl-tripeptide--D-alanyl-D-alanine ligase
MNHRGEIAELCKLLEPDVTLVTNVGTSHIGELGSQDEIAKAKNEIYQEAPNSLKIFNLDNSFTKKMFENYKSQSKCVTFSKTKKANVMLDAEVISLIKYQINGFINDSKISSPFYVLGLQNIENLMAALCIGYSCGLSATQLEDKINLCRTSWGRNQLVSLKSGAIVIFDGYNANLESMSALFETIKRDSKSKKGKIILFLGEIFEQGEFAEQSHFQLGQMAAKVNADDTFFVGENYIAFGRGYESISIRKKPILSNAYKESLAFQLKTMLKPDDVVLIKASRGMNFERVVNALDPIDF